MAIALADVWSNTTLANPTNITIAPSADDYLLCWACTDNSNSGTPTYTAGWTGRWSVISTLDGMHFMGGDKDDATGAETILSINQSSQIGAAMAFSGVNNSNPRNAVSTAAIASTGNTSPQDTSASVTTTVNNCMLVMIVGVDVNSAVNATFTCSDTLGLTWSPAYELNGGSNWINGIAYTATQPTAGAVTVTVQSTTTGASAHRGHILFALEPAGGGSSDGTATPSGNGSTSAVGTSTGSGAATTSPSGVASSAQVGTAVARVSVASAPSGVSSASSVGTAAASGTAVTTPSGQSATSTLGTATANVAAAASPNGSAAATNVGSAVVSGTAVATPSGVSATASVGTATAGTSESGTATPNGVAATSAIGQAVGRGAAIISLAGVTSAASIGTATTSGSAIIQCHGVSAISALGTAIASQRVDATALPAGLGALFHLGIVVAAEEIVYSRSPAGSGYLPLRDGRQSRTVSGSQSRRPATQRNAR